MDPCIFCVEKHVAKARVFVTEAVAGYPARIGMAVGELAAAEEEAPSPQIARHIRAARKRLEVDRSSASIDWEQLLVLIERSIDQLSPKERARRKRAMQDEPGQRGCCGGGRRKRLDQPEPASMPAETPQAVATSDPGTGTRPTLVLLTALNDFVPSYSLTSVILDQARAGAMAGYDVHLAGMQTMAPDRPRISGVTYDPVIPTVPWKEDAIDDDVVKKLRAALHGYLRGMGPAIIITHDLIFQSWYINISKAIHQLDIPDIDWYHQVHSSVGDRPPEDVAQWRASCPTGHTMVAVNWSDIPRLAAYYQTPVDSWVTVPNIVDPARFLGVGEHAQHLYDTYWSDRDVIQTYPLSTPRARSKGVGKILEAFAQLKHRQGRRPLLVLVNAHADGHNGREVKLSLDGRARELDLTEQEVVWTSDVFQDMAARGLPRESVRDLFLLSNVFLFPSISEACGLIMLEAAVAGNALILNRSLPVLSDYIPHPQAQWVEWGSGTEPGHPNQAEQAANATTLALSDQTSAPWALQNRIRHRYSLTALATRLKEL